METQTQQPQTEKDGHTRFPGVPAAPEPAPKRSSRTKLFLFYRTAAGEQELGEFGDKGELDTFLDMNEIQPIAIIRGNMKVFKNRVVFA